MPPSKPPSRPVPPRLAALLADRYRMSASSAGGMATVYLARDVKHDREVALKVLAPRARRGPRRRAVPERDPDHGASSITRISSRCIDSGAAEGFLYYVLPFVRGESLRDDWIGRSGS